MRKILHLLLLPLAVLFLLAGCSFKLQSFDYHIRFMVDDQEYAYVGTDQKTIKIPKDPTKEHYIFDGWFWDKAYTKDFTLLSIVDQPLSENNDYDVYAKWLGEECSFTYGYNQTLTGTVRYGEKIEVEIPKRDNYLFTGYYLDQEQITDEQGQGLKPWYHTENKTLTAKWTEDQITLKLSAETTVTPNSKKVTYLTNIGDLPTPKDRTGYDFVGWYTEKEGKGKLVTPTTACTFTETTTLYAHWSPKTYTATLDWGQGAGPETCTFTYKQPIEIPAPTSSPTGMKITSWGCYEEYSSWNVGEDIVLQKAGDVTLHATWELADYVVTFSFDARYATENYPSPYTIEAKYGYPYTMNGGVVPTLERVGYEYGWYTQPTGGERVFPSSNDCEIAADHTLYAQWRAISYEVTLCAPGYDGTLPTLRYQAGEQLADLPLGITRAGQKLMAWKESHTTTIYTRESYMPAYGLELEGVWTEHYTSDENVTYHRLKEFTLEDWKTANGYAFGFTTGNPYAMDRVFDEANNRVYVLENGQVTVYNATSFESLGCITSANAVDIDAYGGKLAVASGQTVTLYALDSLTPFKTLSLSSNVESVKLTNDALIVSGANDFVFYALDDYSIYKEHTDPKKGALAINREDGIVYRLKWDSVNSNAYICAYTIATGELITERYVGGGYTPTRFYFAGFVKLGDNSYDKTSLAPLGSSISEAYKAEDDQYAYTPAGKRAEALLFENEEYAVVRTYRWVNRFDEENSYTYYTLRLFDKSANAYIDEIEFNHLTQLYYGYTTYLPYIDYQDGVFLLCNGNYVATWKIPA